MVGHELAWFREVCKKRLFFGVVAVMRLTSIAAFGHDEDKAEDVPRRWKMGEFGSGPISVSTSTSEFHLGKDVLEENGGLCEGANPFAVAFHRLRWKWKWRRFDIRTGIVARPPRVSHQLV